MDGDDVLLLRLLVPPDPAPAQPQGNRLARRLAILVVSQLEKQHDKVDAREEPKGPGPEPSLGSRLSARIGSSAPP